MLIAAIAIILLVVGGVGTMSVVMQENAEVANEVIIVSNHATERGQEEVEVTRESTGLQLYNSGPDVKILEYRVVDDGALVRSCPALLEVGSTKKEIIGGTEPALKDCWDEYDDPDERFQIVTARGKIFTLEESGGGNGTTTIINNIITPPQNASGVGAGALGTSGRMVPTPLDGYVVYGTVKGEPGTVQEATTFNYYTGSISYVGVIPNKDYAVRYSLGSPYGSYYAANQVLEPTGSSANVDVAGINAMEGGAPVVRDYGREVEIDVNGKALVRLDGTHFGNRVAISVDTDDVAVKVVTSPNDLVNAEYRDFNGTGKFVLFEGDALYGPETLEGFYRSNNNQGGIRCPTTYGYHCYNFAGIYAIQNFPPNGTWHWPYAGSQRAIPNMLDVYVSDVTESLHSNATLTTKWARHLNLSYIYLTAHHSDGIFVVNSTFVDGLWHITSLAEEAQYTIGQRMLTSDQGYARGYAAAHGTHTVADVAPYSVHGNVGQFDSQRVNVVPNHDVYVLLDGTGTVRIGATDVADSANIDIGGLPRDTPWVFETGDGELLHAGITTSGGTIMIPVPEYSTEDGNVDFVLLVYENGVGGSVGFDDMLVDVRNKEIIRRDFNHPTHNVIYVPEMYMLYPMTARVTIDDVLLGDLTTDCNVADYVRLRYLEKEYDIGSSMYVPFVPKMSALKLSIDGTPVCIKFADVVPPVQLIPFRGDTASGKDAPKIDLEVDGRVSTILSTNSPASVTVSFSASGFSDVARYAGYGGVTLRGPGGESVRCDSRGQYGFSDSCPSPADSMIFSLERHVDAARSVLHHSFTQYEVTVNVFKNGQPHDTVILPINSLSAVQNEIRMAMGTTLTDDERWNYEIEPLINNTTVSGGTGNGSPYGLHDIRGRSQYNAMATSSWGETFTHTFDIHDGNVGDHIEVEISNKVTFRFPYPNGHHTWINSEQRYHYDWPPTFTTQIENGHDFLGSRYDELEIHMSAAYGPNDRGVLVNLNDGFIMVVPAS